MWTSTAFRTVNLLKPRKTFKCIRCINYSRVIYDTLRNNYTALVIVASGVATVACVALFSNKKILLNENSAIMKFHGHAELMADLNARERRFLKFASVEYHDKIYMTPMDFLDSLISPDPRPRLKRKILSKDHIERIEKETPRIDKNSSSFFRNLKNNGLITFTEYIFLNSVLIRPSTSFEIAFEMYDSDGNNEIDINEFYVIQEILGEAIRNSEIDEITRKVLLSLLNKDQSKELFIKDVPKDVVPLHRKIIKALTIGSRKKQTPTQNVKKSYYEERYDALPESPAVPTTLQIHLFGPKGDGTLKFSEFQNFMQNLQTEILEIEFNAFSKGQPIISEMDFCRFLFRYTPLDYEEESIYYNRCLERIPNAIGITFPEFKDFFIFLGNINNFNEAMRMFRLANKAISQADFIRAVKISTGVELSEHIVETVFAIFDDNGDGLLSYKEFNSVMTDRANRGQRFLFKRVQSKEARGWSAFKSCMKYELHRQ